MLAEPRPVGAGLAPGMGQLNTGNGALGVDEAGDALQGFDLFIIPQTEILGRDTPVGGDRRGFGKHQPGPADSTAAEVDQMPVIGQAIGTGILAHRRYRDAVGQG
ncbi:hypothetical protein D3C76_1022380 [compost metagenome]